MYCICFTCDDRYALQVGVAIYSLYKNNQDLKEMDTIVFSDNISYESKQKLNKIADQFKRNLFYIESSDILQFIRDKGIKSSVDEGALSTYVRLFIVDNIDPKYDRVIYIDADTMTVGSIRELVETELKQPIAAVVDIMSYEYRRQLGLGDSYYFSGGVLVIDTASWKAKDCYSIIMDEIAQSTKKYLYGDQDILNVLFKDQIAVLPLKYNLFPFYSAIKYSNLRLLIGEKAKYYSEQEYVEAKANAVIIHMAYSVADRPWMKGNINEYSAQWAEYVEKTPWKKVEYKNRKSYSRTRLMQMAYKLFGEKAVIQIERIRNNYKYKKHERTTNT